MRTHGLFCAHESSPGDGAGQGRPAGEPDEFLALVTDAARRLAPPHPEPATYFTPDQQAALTDVGLDLSPARPSDAKPRTRTVVAHAVLRDSALTVNDAARQLQVDTSRIRHRLGVGRLVGLEGQGQLAPARVAVRGHRRAPGPRNRAGGASRRTNRHSSSPRS